MLRIQQFTRERAVTSTEMQRRYGAGWLTAASALSFGVLGWLVAHALTYWVLEHAHLGGADAGVRHVHGGAISRLAVVAACLAGFSILTLLLAPLLRPPSRGDRHTRGWQLSPRRCSELSTAAFVAAEFAEYGLHGDHSVPPVMVLVVGCVLHAFVGAGAALLWRECAFAAQRWAGLLWGSTGADVADAINAWHGAAPRRRGRWVNAFRGRAPPTVSA